MTLPTFQIGTLTSVTQIGCISQDILGYVSVTSDLNLQVSYRRESYCKLTC